MSISDAEEGGERIKFPDVSLEKVEKVVQILDEYNPLRLSQHIRGVIPNVLCKPT